MELGRVEDAADASLVHRPAPFRAPTPPAGIAKPTWSRSRSADVLEVPSPTAAGLSARSVGRRPWNATVEWVWPRHRCLLLRRRPHGTWPAGPVRSALTWPTHGCGRRRLAPGCAQGS